MTDRYEKIRKALEMGPTPGPWDEIQHEGSRWTDICQGSNRRYETPIAYVPPISVLNENGLWKENKGETAANAKHIAACDPDTIRALLEERDQLVAALAHRAHPTITFCDNCGCDWLDNGLNPVSCPYCTIRELMEALRNALPVLEFEVKTRGSVDLLYKTPAGPVLDAARAAIAKAEGRSDE